jgi:hypothetical protein
MTFIRKYWLEVLTIGAIFAGLLICNNPDMTWINTDSDGAHYILAAKYLTTAHHMSQPLYILIGNLFLRIPLGTDAWRMGLISVLATTIACTYIYLSVRQLLKNNTKARLYGIVAALVYGGSCLVITQSTIVETMPLAVMAGVIAYYYHLKGRYTVASIFCGIGLAVHPFLGFIVWAVLWVGSKQIRSKKNTIITILFFLFYLYIPIVKAVNPGATIMWGNDTAEGFFAGTYGMVSMLVGGLSIYDLPKRILDTMGIVGISFTIGMIPLVWYFIKRHTYKDKLFWLILIPIGFFMINLSAETFVYMIVSVAFGAIAIGVGLSKLHINWSYATGAILLIVMVVNFNMYDIGRTLDPNLSAHKFYTEELPKIKDGEIYMGGGWTWAIVYLYNHENGTNIIPVCTDTLPADNYLDILEEQGINLQRTDSDNWIEQQWLVARSIAELNDNVWIAKETVPSSYEYEVVRAVDNTELFTRWLGQDKDVVWNFTPSNPYRFITGSLQVDEWKFILWSNRNCLFFIVVGGLCYMIGHYGQKFINEKTKIKTKKEVSGS